MATKYSPLGERRKIPTVMYTRRWRERTRQNEFRQISRKSLNRSSPTFYGMYLSTPPIVFH